MKDWLPNATEGTHYMKYSSPNKTCKAVMDVSASQSHPTATTAIIGKMKTPCPCPKHLPAIQEAKKDGLTFSKLIHTAERNRAQKMSYIKLIFEYTNNWRPKLDFSCISVNAAQHPWVDGIFCTVNGGRTWPLEGCNRKKGECIPLSGFAGELIVVCV